MKYHTSIIFTLLFILQSNIAHASPESATDEDLESYMSECNAPTELYDPEIMAKTMSDPIKFMQLVETINNSATANTLLECATHPEQMRTILESLSNPVKYMNMMVIFMNPQTYMNWISASTDPEFNQSEFEMLNASEMSKTFEKFYELLSELKTKMQ